MKHISVLRGISPTIRKRLIKAGITDGSQLEDIHPSVIMEIAKIGVIKTLKIYREAADIELDKNKVKQIYNNLHSRDKYKNMYADYMTNRPQRIKTRDVELRKIDVKVNPVSELLRIKKNRYQDSYDFIKELYQNSHRANATEVKINITEKEIIFQDNGIGISIDDVERVFEIGSSGWDSELIDSQDAFGQGLFASIILSNHLVIESGSFIARWDVKKALKDGLDNSVTILSTDNYFSGFKITLTDMESTYNKNTAQNRAYRYGLYMPFKVYINNNLITQVSFTENSGMDYYRNIKLNRYGKLAIEGWIAPSPDSWSSPDIYYFNIDYGYLSNISDCAGKINILDNYYLTRSEASTINNGGKETKRLEKYLEEKIKEIFFYIVKNGSNEDIARYESGINTYLPLKILKKTIKITVYDPSVLNKIFEYIEKTNPGENTEDIFENMSVDEIDNVAEKAENTVNEDFVENKNTQIEKPKNKKIRINKIKKTQTGTIIGNITKPIIWFRQKEAEEYHDIINELKYYGYAVTMSTNRVQSRIMDETNNFIYITELQNANETRVGKLIRVGATTYTEKRAIWFLSFIANKLAKKFKATPPKITFAYLDIYEKSNFSNINIKRKLNPQAIANSNKIVFDRKYIKNKLQLLKENKYPIKDKVIGVGDIDFLRSVKETFAHEMAHYFFGTKDNTKNQFEKQSMIQQEIDNILISLPKISKISNIRNRAMGVTFKENEKPNVLETGKIVGSYRPTSKKIEELKKLEKTKSQIKI